MTVKPALAAANLGLLLLAEPKKMAEELFGDIAGEGRRERG